MKKPKLDTHRSQCHASFTCIDCSTTFDGPAQYKSHTQCISEAEKYQKGLYKGPKSVRLHSQSRFRSIKHSQTYSSRMAAKTDGKITGITTVTTREAAHRSTVGQWVRIHQAGEAGPAGVEDYLGMKRLELMALPWALRFGCRQSLQYQSRPKRT